MILRSLCIVVVAAASGLLAPGDAARLLSAEGLELEYDEAAVHASVSLSVADGAPPSVGEAKSGQAGPSSQVSNDEAAVLSAGREEGTEVPRHRRRRPRPRPSSVGGAKSGKAGASSKASKSAKSDRDQDRDRRGPECTVDADCTNGHPESRGCVWGHCRMCVPTQRRRCYCTHNEVQPSYSIYLDDEKYSRDYRWVRSPIQVKGIPSLPIGGGQYDRACNRCGRNLVEDGTFDPSVGFACIKSFPFQTMQALTGYRMNPDFFPQQDTTFAYREPAGCMPDASGCNLFCGWSNLLSRRMTVPFTAVGSSGRKKVDGLPLHENWASSCQTCGNNLELAGFVEAGWTCSDLWPVTVELLYEIRYN